MLRTSAVAICFLLVSAVGQTADPSKYTTKQATTELPKELADPIRAVLSDKTVQVMDEQGKLFCEVWFRKEVPVKATADEIKKGVTYTKIEEGTVMGAVRFAQPWQSFRKQNVKPGLYTLRLGIQPMDGDHMGSAPFSEFLLLCPAAEDKKADVLAHKPLTQLSSKALADGNHPVVLLMFPNAKPDAMPQLSNKGSGVWSLQWKTDAVSGTDKGVLGLGLVLFGVTTAE